MNPSRASSLESARRARELALEGFNTGLTGYLDVIAADRTALESYRSSVQLVGLRLIANVQLVKALGGRAFGTSRTPDKIERAKAFGLESGYAVPEPSALKELSNFAQNAIGGHGFDVVLELNGGPYFAASLEAAALKGRIILIGGVAGGKTNVDLYQILRKRLHVIGTVMRARTSEEKIATTRAFAGEVVPLLAQGTVQPVIDSMFPLEKIQDAHRRLESNETFGKVVLTIP